MPRPLQRFFEDERLRRGWSMRQIAERSHISLSKAYAIANGDDNVEFETFENIATALDMTPAELAIAIGKGNSDHDPIEAALIALWRQVPADRRAAATDMLRGLAVQPTRQQPKRRTLRLHMEREHDQRHGGGTNPSQAEDKDSQMDNEGLSLYRTALRLVSRSRMQPLTA